VATDPNAIAANTHVDGDPFTEDPEVVNDEHSLIGQLKKAFFTSIQA
jgi:hypothetical protein